MRKPTLVLVTGQHRSGTSATAGCLAQLGVYLGTHLMPGNQANPKGYFEDVRIVQIHDQLLQALGTSWDRPDCIPATWMDHQHVTETSDQIDSVLREFTVRAGLFAIKDPRACLFMPLWQANCAALGIRLVLLTPRRIEEAIARSLIRREGWTFSRAAEMVVGYRAVIDRIDPKIPRSVIDFPDGLWQASTWERVSRELFIPLDVRDGISRVHRFLDYGLVHHG